MVDDLEKSKQFYESLGFTFRKEIPNISATAYLNWFWIELLHKDSVVSEALVSDFKAPVKDARQSTHISVENVDEFYDLVVKKGLEPLDKPRDYSWGNREFVMSDPDGYKLVFFAKSKKK